MHLEHCLYASDVEIGVVGLRVCVILLLMYIGLRAWLLAVSGWSLVLALYSNLSLASRPICLRPARDIEGLTCMGAVVSSLGGCIGHILVAMSWYSWIIVMTCAAASLSGQCSRCRRLVQWSRFPKCVECLF